MSALTLLLADEERPALPEGADEALLAQAPGPRGARKVEHLWAEDMLNDLAKQRWAVIYPRSRPELLDAARPLIALREEQQRHEALPLPVDPTDDGAALYAHLYDGEMKIADQPRYLLILGDLHEVSQELQTRLSGTAAIGRLAFDALDGYRAYADKVKGWEERAAAAGPRLLLYGAYDAYDGAMRAGELDLLAKIGPDDEAGGVLPGARQSFGRTRQRPAEGLGALLAAAREERPSILLSVTHGLGSARWSSEERHARQGALRVAPGQALEAGQLSEGAFLPGGLWACFACFGAGTPAGSRYEPWLRELVSRGALGGAPDVLGTLSTDRPFVSAIAKAALANGDGPLGVLGHVDLAWGWSFRDEAAGGQSRAQRLASLLESAAQGDRFGLGLGPLARARLGAGHKLVEQAERELQGRSNDAERRARGHDWMTWHDLGAWVLLGDPAARLSLPPSPAPSWGALLGMPGVRPTVTVSPPSGSRARPSVETQERLIHALLANEPDLPARAAAAGLGWSELLRLMSVYTEAGRRALERLGD